MCKQILFLLLTLLSFIFAESIHKTLVVEERLYNPDGFPRQVIAIFEEGAPQSRPFPGPTLRARLGDTVYLTIKNRLETKTSIHCHGLHMHRNPWMDGATGITECGINPGSSFTYVFNVTQTGTYWYHSHTGTQYIDGQLGPLILDYPIGETDPVQRDFPYSTEHVITMQDWMHETARDLELYYKGPYGAFPGFEPKYPWPTVSLLINGHGTFDCQWDDCSWLQRPNNTCESSPQCIPIRKPFFGACQPDLHSLDEFECPTGQYVRLRLINGASNLPFRFWVDQHRLTLVSRDGAEIEYVTVDNVTVPVAQRIDAILKCDQNESFKYKIYVAIEPNCLPHGANLRNITASAYLTYPNASQIAEPQVTPYTPFHNDMYFEYQHLKPKVARSSPAATKRFVVTYNVAWTTSNGAPLEEWVLNNVSFIPPSQPLLPGLYNGLPLSQLIREEQGPTNLRKTIIEPLEYDQVYEIVLIGNDMQPHPWHFHGNRMDFIDAGSILPYIETEETDVCNQTLLDISRLPNFLASLPSHEEEREVVGHGDSFMVPGYGYVVLRFKADNPGLWLFHCHISWHMALGMAMLFSVEKAPGQYDILEPTLPESCVAARNNVVEETGGDKLLPYQISMAVFATLVAMTAPLTVYGIVKLRRKLIKKAQGYSGVIIK